MRQTISEAIRSSVNMEQNCGRSAEKTAQSVRYTLHMLKNEMSKIQLAVRLIREQVPEEVSNELDIIEHATLRVEEFIAKIRVSSGEIQIVSEKTDICALIRDTVKEQTNGWQGTTVYRMEKESLMLYCDPLHMREVLCNLVSNALDAMGEDGTLTVACQTMGKQAVQIKVSDTGCGMDEQAMKHIFDLCYTGHPDRSHFGMGLSYCREVLQRHGGSIRVTSSVEPENHGTEMILCLPRAARRGKGKDEDRHKSADRRG